MFHEPVDEFFYSSYKVEATYEDDIGTKKSTVATAFILDLGDKKPYLVTNRHVVDIDYRQKTSKYKDFKLSELKVTGRRPDDSLYTLSLHEDATIYFHADKENDVAIIEARIYFLDGNESLHWHFGVEQLAKVEDYKSIKPFDLVCFTGFPYQHDKYSDRPILRSGHIASDPRYDYSWNSSYEGKCIAYEGFSSGGASGSPVFAPPRGLRKIPNSRHGFLIGVNAGHLPSSEGHSGISYFYKSTVILDIIEQYNL